MNDKDDSVVDRWTKNILKAKKKSALKECTTWKVILAGSGIQFAKINAHPMTSNCSSRYQFILFICYDSDSTFLKNYMNKTKPPIIGYGIDHTSL